MGSKGIGEHLQIQPLTIIPRHPGFTWIDTLVLSELRFICR